MILPKKFNDELAVALYEGHDVAFVALKGSQNYNLDIVVVEEGEVSDFDYNMFIFPTPYDLFKKNKLNATQNFKAEGKELEIVVKDFRELPTLIDKQNIATLELFCSLDTRYIDNPYIRDLIDFAPQFSRMNLPRFYDSALGSAKEMYKKITHPTEKTQRYFDLYGYNPKAAMGCKRILDTIIKFAENRFDRLWEALRYEGNQRKDMLEIKNGRRSLDEIKMMLDYLFKEVEKVMPQYKVHLVDERARAVVWDKCYKAFEYQLEINARQKYVDELRQQNDKSVYLREW